MFCKKHHRFKVTSHFGLMTTHCNFYILQVMSYGNGIGRIGPATLPIVNLPDHIQPCQFL